MANFRNPMAQRLMAPQRVVNPQQQLKPNVPAQGAKGGNLRQPGQFKGRVQPTPGFDRRQIR